MTRINCIPVEELTREHLLAEYRELPRLAAHAAQKFKKNSKFTPPATYRLGPGHMDFFVDKGAWLKRRHQQLVEEMTRRGYQVSFPDYPSTHPTAWMHDWQVTEEAQILNRERIRQRLQSMKNN